MPGVRLVQGDEGPAQVVQLGYQSTPSVICQRPVPSARCLPHTISPVRDLGFGIVDPLTCRSGRLAGGTKR
jgi:hypothetical protein